MHAATILSTVTATLAAMDDSSDDEEPNRQGQGPRERPPRVPTRLTRWWNMITHSQFMVEGSNIAKVFRRRYRVYPSRFKDLVVQASTWTFVDSDKLVFAPRRDLYDERTVFVEIKVMLALRWLASGASFDMLGELSQTSETTARVSCLNWIKYFVASQYAIWVHPPTGEYLRETMEIYMKCGFPGCVASMDCVHVAWGMCPASRFNDHKGKEGYPTVVFEVVVDHLKQIMAVSRVHRGTINDKSIVRLDDFVQKLREGKVFMGVTYRLWKDDGTYGTRNDPYLLVDGGYHKWKQLQAVMQHLSDKWQRELSCITASRS